MKFSYDFSLFPIYRPGSSNYLFVLPHIWGIWRRFKDYKKWSILDNVIHSSHHVKYQLKLSAYISFSFSNHLSYFTIFVKINYKISTLLKQIILAYLHFHQISVYSHIFYFIIFNIMYALTVLHVSQHIIHYKSFSFIDEVTHIRRLLCLVNVYFYILAIHYVLVIVVRFIVLMKEWVSTTNIELAAT
jgi:hypothetical protein